VPKTITELKVFLASPSDVGEERVRARRILQQVSEAVGEARGFHLKAFGWEDVPPDLGDPQNLINSFSEEADLVVVVFARRFGTPTTQSPSGTFEEFTRARQQWLRRGTPRVMLFFRTLDPESLSDPGPQLGQVLRFRRAFEADRAGLFETFGYADDFEAKFQRHLLRWLEEVHPRGPQPGAGGAAGSPATHPAGPPATLAERIERARQAAHEVFTPSSPVLDGRLLEERKTYLGEVAKARRTRGKTVVLFGPPASGKTSLLKILEAQEDGVVYRAVDRGHAWTLIMGIILDRLAAQAPKHFANPVRRITPDEAAERLAEVPRLVIVDDFENVKPADRILFTELVKKLSNRRAQVTLLLAGRASALDLLMPDVQQVLQHLSVIEIPAFTAADLARIVDHGFASLGIRVEPAAKDYILAHSDGLAHRVHQYCLDCVYALDERMHIRDEEPRDLVIGLKECELAERPTVG
jgi:hypothetical protein